MANLLRPLIPHLQHCDIATEDLDLDHPSLLVIEDFGTTGLTGASEDEDAVNTNWYGFFRNFGGSNKTGHRGGRWGLGKLVFTSASRVRAFFALTVRNDDDDRKPLLMGQAILSSHKIGDARYDTHGFFAVPHEEGALQLPVQDNNEIARFVRVCNLQRRQNPGLSIVIPFPQIERRGAASVVHELARHLISNFFFPILSGDLIAEVCGSEVSAFSFNSLVESLGADGLNAGKLAVFVREMTKARARDPDVVLQTGWYNAIGSAMPNEILAGLRLRFADGNLMFVRFPIRIRSQTGDVSDTYVDVFLRKTKAGEQPASICTRGMLTVPGEAKKLYVEGCFIGLVASDEVITSFLGDAEGPSHTDWNAREQKVRANWRNSDARLREVRQAPRQLHAALAALVERTEKRALIDEFWIPRAASSPPDTATSDPRKRKSEFERPPSRLGRFAISRRPDGFAIVAGPGLQEGELPLRVRIRAAYDLLRGDPFKNHSPLDFDLGGREDIDIDLHECRSAPPLLTSSSLRRTPQRSRRVLRGSIPTVTSWSTPAGWNDP